MVTATKPLSIQNKYFHFSGERRKHLRNPYDLMPSRNNDFDQIKALLAETALLTRSNAKAIQALGDHISELTYDIAELAEAATFNPGASTTILCLGANCHCHHPGGKHFCSPFKPELYAQNYWAKI